jgi:hypothetical protein
MQKLYIERFSLKKLNEAGEEQYQVKIPNSFGELG